MTFILKAIGLMLGLALTFAAQADARQDLVNMTSKNGETLLAALV